jgi:Na+/H+-dicarboxylate symporter
MRNLKPIKNAIWSTISVGVASFLTMKLTGVFVHNGYFWLYLLSLTFCFTYIVGRLSQPTNEVDGSLVVVDSDVGSDLGLSLFITIDELKKRDSVEFSVRYSESQHKQ